MHYLTKNIYHTPMLKYSIWEVPLQRQDRQDNEKTTKRRQPPKATATEVRSGQRHRAAVSCPYNSCVYCFTFVVG